MTTEAESRDSPCLYHNMLKGQQNYTFLGPNPNIFAELNSDQTYISQFCVPGVPLESVTSMASALIRGLSFCNLQFQNSESQSHHVAVSGPRRATVMREVASLTAKTLAHKRPRHQKPSCYLQYPSAHMFLTT